MLSQDFIIYFILIYTICGFVVKTYLLNVKDYSVDRKYTFLILSPFYSTKTWSNIKNINKVDIFSSLKKFSYLVFISVLVLVFYKLFLNNLSQYHYIIVLVSIIPFYLITEIIGKFCEIIFILFNRTVPEIHNKPFQAKNITQFWGNGWNIWVRDWLFEITPKSIRRTKYLNTIFPFLVSGIWHEIIINLPLFIITQINIFGTMTLYFLLQSLGVITDKKFFRYKNDYNFRYMFCLLVAIGPSPLFFNDQLLQVFFFDLVSTRN
ncbi:MAG: hypothetical protein GTN59_17525 [Candidatus Dadabacteria bacterium]|nr:hypothetical protein [Candidatus Dadabacteria bacterium]